MAYPSGVDIRRQRIHEAQLTGLRNRIRDHWHVPEERADVLIDRWTQEAERRSLPRGHPTYWPEAEAWLREQVEPRPLPAGDTDGGDRAGGNPAVDPQ
jgi:hypothetical protein